MVEQHITRTSFDPEMEKLPLYSELAMVDEAAPNELVFACRDVSPINKMSIPVDDLRSDSIQQKTIKHHPSSNRLAYFNYLFACLAQLKMLNLKLNGSSQFGFAQA